MSREGWLLVRAGGRTVGLALEQVIEVLDLGPVYPVPSTEPAVRGVTSSRGRIVPLVHLASLLEGRAGAAGGGTAVMVQLGGRRICLEVDDAEEVLREPGLPVPPDVSLPFAVAVVRREDGIIPLLDLTAIGARIVETFRVGFQEFAFDILQIQRILRYEPPARLPQSPGFLEGVVQYGGGAVPVVDLRKRFELEAPIRDETRLMIVDLGEQRVGVLVDEVREVLRVDSRTISAPGPVVSGLAAAYISGLVTRPGRTIIILNARKLLSSTERLALSAMGTG